MPTSRQPRLSCSCLRTLAGSKRSSMLAKRKIAHGASRGIARENDLAPRGGRTGTRRTTHTFAETLVLHLFRFCNFVQAVSGVQIAGIHA